MYYDVCTKYCGEPILLEEFEEEEDALNFMSRPYTLYYKDEIENGTEDEVIYPKDMYMEKRLNKLLVETCTPEELNVTWVETDELPF